MIFHQACEKTLMNLAWQLKLPLDPRVTNTLITIVVSLITVLISYPLCCNIFLNLVQGLPKDHAELITELKEDLKEKAFGKWEIVESQFWILDMSYIIGSITIRTEEVASIDSGQKKSMLSEITTVLSPYISELTIQFESPKHKIQSSQ